MLSLVAVVIALVIVVVVWWCSWCSWFRCLCRCLLAAAYVLKINVFFFFFFVDIKIPSVFICYFFIWGRSNNIQGPVSCVLHINLPHRSVPTYI